MKSRLCRNLFSLIFIVCFFFQALASAQDEKVKQEDVVVQQSVASATATLKNGERHELIGKLTFTLTILNSDDSIEGTLAFTLAEESRRVLAEKLGMKASDIPLTIEKKSALAFPEKNTLCPNLMIELLPAEIQMESFQFQMERTTLKLDLEKNSEALSNYFCGWVRAIKAGRGHPYRLARRVNSILTGKPLE